MQDTIVPQSKEPRLVAFLLVLVTVLVYLPAMNGGFVFDDKLYIVENQFLRTTEGLKHIWFNPTSIPQYYPLTFTTFWLEFQLWSLWPTGYHVVNVFLHASNAILLLLLCRKLAIPGAWLVAAIFALHPVQVESVAWIAERKNVLSGFFYLTSIICYLRFSPFHLSHADSKKGFWRYYWFALALFFCALLSKTATCTLPAVLLLIYWWKRGQIHRSDILPLAPMFFVSLISGIVTALLEREIGGAVGQDWSFSIVDRILIAGRALWFYVSKLFWPITLTFFYPKWTIDPGIWWQYLFPCGALLILAILVLAHGRIGRGPTVAVLFFAGTLAPVLGFFNVYFMRYAYVADHFQYLASIGLIALAVGLCWRGHSLSLDQLQARELAGLPSLAVLSLAPGRALLTFCVLVSLGILTWKQAHMYADPQTLWQDTLKKNPASWAAHNNLGVAFLTKGDYDHARQQFQSAITLKPDLAEAQSNLSLALLKVGQLETAIEHGQQAILLKPDSSKFHSVLGSAFWRKGDIQQAAKYFREAIRHEPTVPQAHYNLGLMYLKEASAFQDIHLREAITHFEKALALNQKALQTVYTLAWTLATHPDSTIRDGARAVQLAEEACRRTEYQDPILLDTLAAAYAEVGRFQDAIQIDQKAVQMASLQKQEKQVRQIMGRIQLYQSGQPYRDALPQQEQSQSEAE